MKPYTITIDEQHDQALATLIIAAGKSPATDGRIMMLSSDMLRWLAAAAEAAQKETPPAAGGDNVVSMKSGE